MVKPWEQQPNEPDAAYKRFLFYRNLGPTRSLEQAYSDYLNSPELDEDGQEKGLAIAPKSPKKPQVSGQWKEDSRTWDWENRANQWDIHVLSTAGKTVIDRFYKILGIHADQLFQMLAKGDVLPTNYDQLISGLLLLGSYITPEAVEAWRATADSGGDRPSTNETTK